MASVRRTIPLTRVSKIFVIVAALALFCGRNVWSQIPAITALVHVNVVDVRSGHIETDSCVVIKDRLIIAVGKSCGSLSPSHRQIEGKGGFLIPGLWDMHVHSDGKQSALTSMLHAGLTGVRDMGGNLENLRRARNEIQSGKWESPMLLFAGPLLEGPPAEPEDDIWIIHDANEARSAVGKLADAHVDFIKVHDNLSREAYFEIVAASKEHKLPFAGHVSRTISPVEASNVGQASIEHFEFLPKPCLPLLADQKVPPGCDSAAIDSMLKIFARNGTYLDLTLQSFQYWVPAQWPTTFASTRGLVRQIRTAQVRILAGTDWGTYLESKGARPGWCLHDELDILVRAGFTPLEALQAATLNPAVFLGMKKELGTIEPGKIANLVLLRANPLANIKYTDRLLRCF